MNTDNEAGGPASASDSAPPRPSAGAILAQATLTLAVLAGGGGFAYWTYIAEEAPTEAAAPPPERAAPLVETVRMEPNARRVALTAWGEIRPTRQVTLSPRVGGYVTEVAEGFSPGAVLEAGDPLVQLDRHPYELALQRARTELTQAESELALEQGQRRVAEQSLELGEVAADERERELMLRVPQMKGAQAAVEAARVSVAEAERALEQTTVRAPFDALVLEREVAVGSEVGASAELATLVGVEQWWVELAVPAGQLKWIDFPRGGGEGSSVRIHLDGQGGKTALAGEVRRLRGDLAEEGRMARVLVRIDDPLGRAGVGGASAAQPLLGAFVRGEITSTQVPKSYALDSGWLRGDREAWLLAPDGTLEVREVEIAHRGGERALVTGGLHPGDRLITSRLAMPAPGMALRSEPGSVRQAKTGPEESADEG
ncbi:MAG: efflux RND transporter periplasmic adaptor subunit [Halofilum sp. (in: g-proteobacteria)]